MPSGVNRHHDQSILPEFCVRYFDHGSFSGHVLQNKCRTCQGYWAKVDSTPSRRCDRAITSLVLRVAADHPTPSSKRVRLVWETCSQRAGQLVSTSALDLQCCNRPCDFDEAESKKKIRLLRWWLSFIKFSGPDSMYMLILFVTWWTKQATSQSLYSCRWQGENGNSPEG
jgi:hypothetical protein